MTHWTPRTSLLAGLVIGLFGAPASAEEATGEPARSAYRAGTVAEVGIPLSGVELGLGWDSRRGEVVPNRCIEFAPIQSRGQATRMHLTEVSDQSEMMRSLNVNAAVSVRTIFASGDAKASFAKSSKVKASSTNLVLQATVDNGVLFVGPKRMPDRARYANPQFGERGEPAPDAGWRQWAADPGTDDQHSLTFRPWAQEFLDNRDGGAFRRHCGDSFVASIQSGAELLALISFTASSESQKQSIKASVSADFGAVQASTDTADARRSSRESSDLQVTMTQIGGSGGPIATTREDLVQKLKLLAMDAAMAPKFHSMQVMSYDSLADWPAEVALTAPLDGLEVIADTYWFLGSFYELLEEIIAEPEAYSYATGLIPSELEDLQDQVVEKRGVLLDSLRDAAEGRVPDDAALATVALRLPGERTFSLPDAARARMLGVESGLPTASAWVDALGAKLGEELPLGNPNTLLLHLPLAKELTAPLLGDEPALRALAVRRHLHDQAKRFCRLDPTDNQCLTNRQLRELEAKVTVNLNRPPASQHLQNIGGGLCLHLREGEPAFETADCAEAARERSLYRTSGGRVELIRTGTCLFVQGESLGFRAPCGDGTEWSFTDRGEIRAGDQCLEARGRGQPVAVVPCTAGDEDLPLSKAWRPLDRLE